MDLIEATARAAGGDLEAVEAALRPLEVVAQNRMERRGNLWSLEEEAKGTEVTINYSFLYTKENNEWMHANT